MGIGAPRIAIERVGEISGSIWKSLLSSQSKTDIKLNFVILWRDTKSQLARADCLVVLIGS